MAAYSFTSSAVLPGGATQGARAGEAINAGEIVYLKASDQKVYKASCDGSVEQAKAVGVAVNSAVAGQPVSYVTSGEVTVDAATFAGVGVVLALSGTPGQCMDIADLVATDYLTIIGWSTDTNKLRVDLTHSGLQLT